MADRPRLLFVSPRFLFPVDSGGKIRTTQILRGMQGGRFRITLISPGPAGAAGIYSAELASVADRHRLWEVKDHGKLYELTRLRHLLSRLPVPVATDCSKAGSQLVERELSGSTDLVVFDFPHSVVLAPEQIRVPSVLFTHNVEAEIFRRHTEVNQSLIKRAVWKNQAWKMEAFEREALLRFNSVVAVSDRDRLAMEKSYGISNVRVIRTGVDLDEFEYAPPKDRPHVVFTGSMDWLANIDGIEFFMRDVWPLIARSVENASMTVVGRDPPRDLVEEVAREGLPWRVTGFVDDVRPFVREASCFVIPLRVGGGTRLKVFEAMAMGCPVVSTRLGVEGLGLVAGQHYLEADTPCEFAASVMRLLEDGQLRLRLSREARAFVADNHSFRSAAADFERICLDTLEQ